MAQHMRGNEITHKLRLGREADAAEVKYYARLWPGPFNKTPFSVRVTFNQRL